MCPARITVRLDEVQLGCTHRKHYLALPSAYMKDRFGHLALGRLVRIAEDAYHRQFLAQVA